MLARRTAPLICICVLASLTACGGEETKKSPPKVATPSPPARPASVQVDSAVFGRRDAPPAGVKAQIEYALGANGPCTEAIDDGQPRVTFYRDPISGRLPGGYQRRRGYAGIGDLLTICLSGFESGAIEISVTDPRGERTSRRLSPLARSAEWSSLPGDSLGEYRVTVRQGSTVVINRFQIGSPRVPGVRVVDEQGNPGDTFRIVVAGLEPRQRAQLQLYRLSDSDLGYLLERFDYATALPVVMGSNGQAVLRLKTNQSESAKNCYLIVGNFDPSIWDGRLCLARDRYSTYPPELRRPVEE